MNTTTRLEPLSTERARVLFRQLREARSDTDTALALDGDGRVIGVVPADDPHQRHVTGDFDAHA